MPVMDGYTAVRTIRAWETEHRRPATPILALTASTLDEDIPRAFEAGCNAHIAKPVRKATLLAAIDETLALVAAGAAKPAPAAPAAPVARGDAGQRRPALSAPQAPRCGLSIGRAARAATAFGRRSPRGAGLSAERQLPTFSSGASAPGTRAAKRRTSPAPIPRTRDHPDESAARPSPTIAPPRARSRLRERGLARHGRGLARRRRRRRGQGRLRARDVRAHRAALRPRQPVDDDGTRPPMAPRDGRDSAAVRRLGARHRNRHRRSRARTRAPGSAPRGRRGFLRRHADRRGGQGGASRQPARAALATAARSTSSPATPPGFRFATILSIASSTASCCAT